jgi:hypothetical protein
MMPHPNKGTKREAMASTVRGLPIREPAAETQELPATFDSAVLRFDPDVAVEAFDVLARGGQYGIVGRLTYVVTQGHVKLLDEAQIPYTVQSVQ